MGMLLAMTQMAQKKQEPDAPAERPVEQKEEQVTPKTEEKPRQTRGRRKTK